MPTYKKEWKGRVKIHPPDRSGEPRDVLLDGRYIGMVLFIAKGEWAARLEENTAWTVDLRTMAEAVDWLIGERERNAGHTEA